MKQLFTLLVLLSTFYQSNAQTTAVNPSIKTSKAVLDDFMDQRFGMFIHWGPVTLRGTEIGWSRGTSVPVQDYDNLYKEFNPVLFNADTWVKTAKEAGMKYLTITSKHHDGFCLWPTKFSNYNIMNSPYKKDIVGELAKACKKYNIKFCVYFTVLDWHDPNYPIHLPDGKNADPKSDIHKFIATMKSQLQEIVT
jgi:alpha-L-fucosidase